MNAVALFFSAALTVFFLGFQQQNVMARQYSMAVLTSIAIGACQIYLWRALPNADPVQIAATLAGGPVGICAAMWAHPRIARWRSKFQ